MKKLMVFMILVLMVASIAMVSAKVAKTDATTTYIAGTIYDSDGKKVGAADITVTCLHKVEGSIVNYTKTTTSKSSGKYAFEFCALTDDCDDEKYCTAGDEVIVTAEKDDMYGVSSGTVEAFEELEINLALIDVIVPEFGVIIALLTVFTSIGMFFFIRRN